MSRYYFGMGKKHFEGGTRLYRQYHSRGRRLTTTGQPTVSLLPFLLPGIAGRRCWLVVAHSLRIRRSSPRAHSNFNLLNGTLLLDGELVQRQFEKACLEKADPSLRFAKSADLRSGWQIDGIGPGLSPAATFGGEAWRSGIRRQPGFLLFCSR
jgi:hypothetical protein